MWNAWPPAALLVFSLSQGNLSHLLVCFVFIRRIGLNGSALLEEVLPASEDVLISQWKMQLSWLGNCSSQHFLKLARAACEPGAQMLHCFLV